MEPITVASRDIPQCSDFTRLRDHLELSKITKALAQSVLLTQDPSLSVRSGSLVYLRYNPSRYCHLFYRLELDNKSGSKRTSLLISGKLFSSYAKSKRANKSKEMALDIASDTQLFYSVFPVDRKITAMSLLYDRLHMQSCIRTLLNDQQLSIAPSYNNQCWATILSYRPERYCLVQLNLIHTNGTQLKVLVRLFSTEENASRNWHLLRQPWKQSRHGDVTYQASVKPLGYDSKRRMCVFNCVSGRSLSELVTENKIGDAATIAARILAQIHTHRLDEALTQLPRRGPQTHLSVCRTIQRTAQRIDQISAQNVSD